jgi:hypothetical protein
VNRGHQRWRTVLAPCTQGPGFAMMVPAVCTPGAGGVLTAVSLGSRGVTLGKGGHHANDLETPQPSEPSPDLCPQSPHVDRTLLSQTSQRRWPLSSQLL